jgi:two-component system, OmpR family, sensor kinase
MFASRRRLRFRLALEFMIVAAAVNALLFLIVLGIREDHARSTFDRDLIQRARSAGFEAARALDRDGALRPDFHEPEMLFALEVLTIRGELLAESRVLQELDLAALSTLAAADLNGDARLLTLEETSRGPVRIATIQVAGRDGSPLLVVHSARSLQPITAALAGTRGMLFVFVLPAATLAAGLAGWLISDRVFRRIGQVTRAAHEIRAGDLSQRLDIPEAGDEIGELVREMNAMISRLEAAFGAQRKFILDVTHELKTPVSIMLSQAQLLARKSPVVHGEQFEEFVGSVEEEMRRLGQLLESFLTLARSAHGATYLAESLVPINDVATEAAERWEPVGRTLGSRVLLNLHVSEDEATDTIVRGDHELLVTLVENLLTAVSDLAGPKRTIELAIGREECHGDITVRALDPDTGEVISPRFLNDRGHELRMAIVQGVAQLHGGEVHSAGTLVTVRLPILSALQAAKI